MVRPGRMLWHWELNNPCAGSAIANLPASLRKEEARRRVPREKGGVCRARKESCISLGKLSELPPAGAGCVPPVVLNLGALCWGPAAGAGGVGIRLLQHLWQAVNHSPPGEPILPLPPNSWAELHVAARAPERQLGHGCVSALVTFCCQMSKVCLCKPCPPTAASVPTQSVCCSAGLVSRSVLVLGAGSTQPFPRGSGETVLQQ